MRRLNALDGVYLLTDAVANAELVLDDGEWYFAPVKATSKVDGSSRPTWLVVNPPGADLRTYILLHMQSGTFAGVWKDEWKEGTRHVVKCSPSHLSAANIQWIARPGLPESNNIVFDWLADPRYTLSREAKKDTVMLRKLDRSSDEQTAPQWRFQQPTPDSTLELWPGWMGHLPDDVRLDKINLPATHQSLANHGISRLRPDLNWNHLGDGQPRPWTRVPFIDNPRCQEFSLWDQLQMGIRGLDIRLDLGLTPVLKREHNGQVHEEAQYFLYARHGLAEMGYSWSAVLLTLRAFLLANPSECVIVNIRYEKSRSASQDRSNDWMSTFVNETSTFWNEDQSVVYKWWMNGAPLMTNLALADVRGKVILTTDQDYMPADRQEGRERGTRFWPLDISAVGKYDSHRDEWDQQLSNCENNLDAAKENDSQRYYQTSLNVSGLPAPLKHLLTLQSLLRYLLHPIRATAKKHWSNDVFDPVDFFDYFQEKWSARGINCPLSEESLGRNGQHRIGKIDLDFCNRIQPWVANIVRSNRTSPGREF